MGSAIVGKGNGSNVDSGTSFEGVVTFGSSAIASQIGNLVTWARTGAGAYTVTFPKTYYALVGASGMFQTSTGAAVPFLRVLSTTNLSVDGTITVEISPEAGTNADPTSGYKLFWRFVVSDSAGNTSR